MSESSTPIPATTQSAIAKVTPGILTSLQYLPSLPGHTPLASWPLDTPQGRAKLHSVLLGDSVSLWRAVANGPLVLAVEDLACSYGEWPDDREQSGVRTGTVFYLVTNDIVYRTSSEGAFRTLRTIADLEGPPPWRPAILVKCYRAPTDQGNTRLAIVLQGRFDSTKVVQTEIPF